MKLVPCLPVLRPSLPIGPDWAYEPKLDGWRLIAIRDGERVALLSRNGHELTRRLPSMVAAVRRIPGKRFVLDGELFAHEDGEDDRPPDFHRLLRCVSAGNDGELAFGVFDLLEWEGSDLRSDPLAERRRQLGKLCAREGMPPCVHAVLHVGTGPSMLSGCEFFGLEGVVAKRVDSPYREGRQLFWVKLKTASWRAKHKERWRLFEKRR